MSDERPTNTTPKLPTQIAAKWDMQLGATAPDPDDFFLVADEKPESFAEGDWVEVGIYKLVETVQVRQESRVRRRKKK